MKGFFYPPNCGPRTRMVIGAFVFHEFQTLFFFFSVNCISTLADIQYCKNLQELYIRKNQIQDLSEICWLRSLTKLKNLWLEENPCAQGGEL